MNLYKSLSPLVIFSLLASGLFLGGCGVWRDFTTYFNIYYNAKDLFKEAELQIAEQKKNPYESYDIPIPSTANANLTKVIEKCSKILQFNRESSFVDESLLMIGKSFYYQQNYIKGLRKFQELIATQPESDLIPEARLWIGKTEMAMKNSGAGMKALEEVRQLAKTNGDNEIITETLIEEVRFELDSKNTEKALLLLSEILSFTDDNSIRAITAYQAGLLQYELSKYKEAATSFLSVLEYAPSFELELDASIQYARALRGLKDYERSLEILEDLEGEAKFSDSFDRIYLEKGVTFFAMKEFQSALELLTRVDTAYRSSSYAGNARFELGKLYETGIPNYDSAAKYYSSALSSAVTAEYLLPIRSRSQLFTRYFQYNTALAGTLAQLRYVDSPDVFIADSLAYYGDTSKSIQQGDQKDFTDDEESFRKRDDNPDELGRERERERETGDERGRERERDVVRENQGGTRNLLPSTGNSQTGKGIPPVRPTLLRDSLLYLAGKASIDLGNVFFLELNRLDSAEYHYLNANLSFKNKYTDAQAMFALGSFFLSQNKKNEADSLFNVIYDNFKTDKVVNSAADKLGKPRIDLTKDPAKDRFIVLEKLFSDPIRIPAALPALYAIADSFPSSGYAPKALLAAGMLLENKLKLYDSAASVYDSLAKKFPYSEQTQRIASKLSLYKEEKARIARIIADSIAALSAPKISADSTTLSDSVSRNVKDSTLIPGPMRPELKTPEDPDPEKNKQEDPEKKEPIPQVSAVIPKRYNPTYTTILTGIPCGT